MSFIFDGCLFSDPKGDDQEWIEVLTKELVDTVEERNNLVEMLEEDRLRYNKL